MKKHLLTRDPRNGNYYARIQQAGVMKRFRFGKNRRQAEQQLHQLEEDLARGAKSFAGLANAHLDKTEPKDITIEELIRRYLQWVEANRSTGTLETARYLLQPFLDRYGECHVSDINHTTLSNFYAWARQYKGRSANGGNKHLEQVKTLLRWGEQMDVCISPIRRFPMIRRAPAKTKKFTDDELPRLLRKCGADFKDLLVFGILTGLRPQELRGLRREHIQQIGDHACVVLERHKTSLSAHYNQPRCVPLSAQAVEIMQRQENAHPLSPFIFLNDHRQPYKADGFRRRLERACKRAGLERRSPYALRHYFGTKQAGNGLNQAILAQLMGHTTIVTTTRYIAKVPDYHQRAVDALQNDLAALLTEAEDIEPAATGKLITLPA
jgi:integrase